MEGQRRISKKYDVTLQLNCYHIGSHLLSSNNFFLPYQKPNLRDRKLPNPSSYIIPNVTPPSTPPSSHQQPETPTKPHKPNLTMSAPNEGRQSPPPEAQSDKQQGAPSDGQGVNKETSNKDESKSQLEVALIHCPLRILS